MLISKYNTRWNLEWVSMKKVYIREKCMANGIQDPPNKVILMAMIYHRDYQCFNCKSQCQTIISSSKVIRYGKNYP